MEFGDIGWYCKAYKGDMDASASVVLRDVWSTSIEKINTTIFKLGILPVPNLHALDNSSWDPIDISLPETTALGKGIYWIQKTS